MIFLVAAILPSVLLFLKERGSKAGSSHFIEKVSGNHSNQFRKRMDAPYTLLTDRRPHCYYFLLNSDIQGCAWLCGAFGFGAKKPYGQSGVRTSNLEHRGGHSIQLTLVATGLLKPFFVFVSDKSKNSSVMGKTLLHKMALN